MNKNSIWWVAPEYFSRWRLFPRAFISMYIYLLFDTTQWFMSLPDPNIAQSGLISVIVGAGAAWFGLYVNSTSTKHEEIRVETVQQSGGMSTKVEAKKRHNEEPAGVGDGFVDDY